MSKQSIDNAKAESKFLAKNSYLERFMYYAPTQNLHKNITLNLAKTVQKYKNRDL